MTHFTYPRFIDFEASGLSEDSYPIEVAWNGEGGSVESYLIKVQDIEEWTHWDPHAETDAHQISLESLDALGDPPAVVAKRMNEALKGETLYSDAIQFDQFWLNRLFEAVNMEPTFTLASAIEVFDQIIANEHKTNGTSEFVQLERFDIVVDTYGLQAWKNIELRPHRSNHDVLHLMETYRLLKEAGGKLQNG
ncbi:hypothetical protein RYZ26_04610 [Terasakiella sp. A23]|uniref:hypothetical protein n=1 Tax=Terasakiella sp. FCG-A23 TaxID=3080561 RepID=UPI0029538C91|nr:hypothetical protein [Terasakiella sp. A23]MDV7338859.1 hypothetical protein [Terasakiella sp. A23]